MWSFCGLLIKHDTAFIFLFLPRKTLVLDVHENLENARLTMRALARFGREIPDRKGVASGGEGNTELLAI